MCSERLPVELLDFGSSLMLDEQLLEVATTLWWGPFSQIFCETFEYFGVPV